MPARAHRSATSVDCVERCLEEDLRLDQVAPEAYLGGQRCIHSAIFSVALVRCLHTVIIESPLLLRANGATQSRANESTTHHALDRRSHQKPITALRSSGHPVWKGHMLISAPTSAEHQSCYDLCNDVAPQVKSMSDH